MWLAVAEISLAYPSAGGPVFVEYGHAAACGDTAGFSTRAGWPTVGPNRAYSAGSTARVNRVALIRPPITTVAKGFCTSAPVPVASAIGTKPSEATSAVITTGRNRINAPFSI